MGIVKLLRLVRFDIASEKTGVKEFLAKGNIIKTPSEIIGSLVYWFVMILVQMSFLRRDYMKALLGHSKMRG